jgi:outer membrane protein
MKKNSLTLVALAMIASSQAAVAFEKGDIIVRVGVANVSPDDASSNIVVGTDLGVNVAVDDDPQ